MYASVGRYFACFLMVFCVGSASAQQGPPKPDENRAAQAPAAATSSVVFERQYMRVRLEADGTGSRTITMHVKVNDALGVRQAGQLPLSYAPSFEALSITTLEVRKPDGRTVVVDREAIDDHVIQPFASSTMFLDLRQKLITVPSLAAGDTIVVVADWTVTRPIIPNHSWYQHSFVKHAVTTDERLEIDTPASLAVTVRSAPGTPVEAKSGTGAIEGNRRIYRWQTSNLKMPSPDDEGPDETPPPDVRVTTFRDWDTLAKWFRPLLHPAPDASVRAKAIELTKGIADRRAKIQAIYDYVSTQIRYVSLSFGLGRFAPHAPAEVLKNQYGDCKDKHALLAAMLDAIGVRAIAVLINSDRDVSSDLPSPGEFDHVITAIPAGDDPLKWTWLDTTTEVAPFGMLLLTLRDTSALFLGGESMAAHVVKTPAEGPFPFFSELEIDGQVNPLGVLVARLKYRLRGDVEVFVRNDIRELPRDQHEEFAKGFAQSLGFKGQVSDFRTTDPLATAQPFEIEFTMRQGGYLSWAAESGTVDAPTGRMPMDLLEDVTKDEKLHVGHDTRRRLSIALPAGYVATAPVGVTVDKHGVSYRSTYAANGNRIVSERLFTLTTRQLVAANAADYGALARTVTSDHKQTFAIRREGKGVPTIPADMTAAELYSAGYSAFDAKDYETAVQLWRRTAELDPKLSSAWSGLGFAYQRLRRYDDAIAAMEKQVELDPSNKRIHTDLGYVAKTAGKFDVAARAYAKHVERNPLDHDAHKMLGEIYLELDDYPAAIRTLEKAASLNKEDVWTAVLLGSAQLRGGLVDTALKSFDRAVGMGSGPAVWTKIGWELASAGTQPAKAADLLGRTTSHIVGATTSLRAADIDAGHHDLMSRLAWCWDAKGMMALKEKNVDRAIRYFDAAWLLGGATEVAEHLGQAYEAAPNRSSDALTAYLIARSLPRPKAAALDQRIQRLAGTTNFEPFMKAAQSQFMIQRSLFLEGDWPQAQAELSAVLDRAGQVVDIKWLSGDDRVRGLETKLQGRKFPLEVPDADPQKLAVKLKAFCTPKACNVVIVPAREAQ